MKIFKKLFSTLLVLALISAIAPQFAAAAAIGASTRKDWTRRVDGNGRDLSLPDIGYKVFELMNATLSALVDEDGVAPVQGVIYQVCMETGSVTTWDTLLFDTTSLLVDVNTTGRRLGPPLYAPWQGTTTETVPCVTLNAQFTRGVVVLRKAAAGGAWVYWLPNGGRR